MPMRNALWTPNVGDKVRHKATGWVDEVAVVTQASTLIGARVVLFSNGTFLPLSQLEPATDEMLMAYRQEVARSLGFASCEEMGDQQPWLYAGDRSGSVRTN